MAPVQVYKEICLMVLSKKQNKQQTNFQTRPVTALGHLTIDHTIQDPAMQVPQTQRKGWLKVLDTAQSTANTTKTKHSILNTPQYLHFTYPQLTEMLLNIFFTVYMRS